jgi:hypothetical protein
MSRIEKASAVFGAEKQIVGYKQCSEGKGNHRYALRLLLVLRTRWPCRKVTFSEATSKKNTLQFMKVLQKSAFPRLLELQPGFCHLLSSIIFV